MKNTKLMPTSARLPSLNELIELTGFNFAPGVNLFGFLPFAILLGVAYYVLLNRSRFGYELRLSGLSPEAARSAGVNPKRMVLITLFMSGAVAGMIGLPYLLADPNFLKYGDAFPTMIGFTGLGLALLGRNNPIGIAAAAIVWATIERATQRLGPIGIPPEIGRILQGVVPAHRRDRLRGDQPARTTAAAASGRRGGHGPAQTRRRTAAAAARQPDGGSTGMTIVADSPPPVDWRRERRRSSWRSSRWLPLAAVVAAFAILSTTRILSDTDDLTSSGTFGVALRTAAPIGLAGLSGLVAERSGTINIGLDGMMVLGTIFAGWWGWEYGPWMPHCSAGSSAA